VNWYDGHPDVPRSWPLNAKQVAVLGNGNVALDVARVLAKQADDMLTTDIPANVYEGLAASPVTDVHVFGRRGPGQIKFTPIELRELGEQHEVDLVVYDEDFPEGWFNPEAEGVTNQQKVMARILESWRGRQLTGAKRRLHLHFFSSPVAILGADGAVRGIRFERTELVEGTENVRGTGALVEFPVQAVYRAIGYFGSELPEIPFNDQRGVISNVAGRVINESAAVIPGLYATGWIKRGPIGLIGHTKSDATETIEHLISDIDKLVDPVHPEPGSMIAELDARGVQYVTWNGWLKLNEHEIALGASDASHVERERVKVVDRNEQVDISRKP
jgi:ferredoxin--NADP+ reductase